MKLDQVPRMHHDDIGDDIKLALVVQGLDLAGMTVSANRERLASIFGLRKGLSPEMANKAVTIALEIIALAHHDAEGEL